jgi:hypothetical protein
MIADLDILEKLDFKMDEDSEESNQFAHYAEAAEVTEAYVMGTPIVALCGKIFVPFRNPEKLPVCPICKEIVDALFLS